MNTVISAIHSHI